MYKAKAWLHSQGHIATAGRGRPPAKSSKDGRDITTILHEASKSGVKFSDWPKGQIEVKKNEETRTDEVKVIRSSTTTAPSNSVVELAPYRFLEEEWKAVEVGTGKTRSLREACNRCRVSLVGHQCDSPTIVRTDGAGTVGVKIVRK